MGDESYENIFSDPINFSNSTFYKITPDITDTTNDDIIKPKSHKSESNNFIIDSEDNNDGYIYDDSIMKIKTKRQNNNDNKNIFENVFDNYYLPKLNKHIKIYNTNVILYQKTALVLEEYFSFIFSSINQCYKDNKITIAKYKLSDNLQNIYRNYDPLLQYIRKMYEIYKHFLFKKIDEIHKYFLTVEKQLLKHSWLLI